MISSYDLDISTSILAAGLSIRQCLSIVAPSFVMIDSQLLVYSGLNGLSILSILYGPNVVLTRSDTDIAPKKRFCLASFPVWLYAPCYKLSCNSSLKELTWLYFGYINQEN